jgi:hypothetical protein
VKRLGMVLFVVAALTWAVLIVGAIRDPEHEPEWRAKTRTAALVVAFVAVSFASTQRR